MVFLKSLVKLIIYIIFRVSLGCGRKGNKKAPATTKAAGAGAYIRRCKQKQIPRHLTGIFRGGFKDLQKYFILGVDIWGDPCYYEATRTRAPHRKEAFNARRSPK